jgi:hypothetical protein
VILDALFDLVQGYVTMFLIWLACIH